MNRSDLLRDRALHAAAAVLGEELKNFNLALVVWDNEAKLLTVSSQAPVREVKEKLYQARRRLQDS